MILVSHIALAMTGLRFLFENDRVRVSDLRLNHGESIHCRLEFPTIRWQVDDGVQLLKVEGKNPKGNPSTSIEGPVLSTITVPDKTVTFEEAGISCHITNGGEGVFRQVWFEIKQRPRRSEAETRRILKNAIYTTDVGTELLFENNLCRVWDFYLEPGGGDPLQPHHHVLDYVFVYVARGRLIGYTHDGKPGLFDSVNEDCDVTWFDLPDGAETMVDCAHGGKNGYPEIPMREYLVELK